ncbi:MAG: 16S rRNA (guanine(527)-N(7))-methyltransferase RsmG [Desulfuromonas sp.]|nr:16S rRNA (guanine(527)-N(7))-methyltransferase RsmG [Desulfuromonas sp.]
MDICKNHVRELLEGIVSQPDKVIAECDIFIHELLKWNARVNLTSIVTPTECWEKHIQDSLLPLPYLQHETSLLDIGSGAGLPSIPLKLCLPEMVITSVDKVRKKINFQNHCKRLLKLKNFNATTVRLEHILCSEKKYAVVTARALASLEELIKLGSPHVEAGGVLLAMKSKVGDEEMERGQIAAEGAAMEFERIIECRLQPSGAERQLIFIRKKETVKL